MPQPCRIFGLLCSIILFCAPYNRAMADRKVFVPASPRAFCATYPGTGAGQTVGFLMSFVFTFTNLSQKSLTGSIQMLPGSEISGGQAGRKGTVNGHFFQCSSNTANGKDYSFQGSSLSGYQGDLPKPVSFGVDANKTSKITVGTSLTHTWSNIAPNNFDSMCTYFSPSFQITVDGDEGALVGSIIPTIDGWNAGQFACDGTAANTNGQPVVIPDYIRTITALPILGGRAF